jgi:hypothetical protein
MMIFRNALIGASAMALNATTSVFPLLLLCAVTIATASSAYADDDAEEWQFRLTPYLWLPVIEGISNYELPPGGGGSPGVSVGPSDWLDLLNFAALVGGSAQKGRFSINTD